MSNINKNQRSVQDLLEIMHCKLPGSVMEITKEELTSLIIESPVIVANTNRKIQDIKSMSESKEQGNGSKVNHPVHYNKHPSGIECIDIVRHMGFNLGNAVKYIWRADLKGASIQDLEKAVWYIKDEIALRAKEKK